jgi:type II secretory pathway component PulK
MRFLFNSEKSEQGIALFIVIAGVSVLTLLVSEFTYMSSISSELAFSGLDQLKAHYLAKTGLKLSLLRLKAYQQLQNQVSNAGLSSVLTGSMIDDVWKQPLVFPVPVGLVDLGMTDKAILEKFQKETNLEGNLTANITAASSKINVNLIIPAVVNQQLSASQNTSDTSSTSSGSSQNGSGNTTDEKNNATAPTVTSSDTQRVFVQLIQKFFDQKAEHNASFFDTLRDLNIPNLVAQIAGWADASEQRKSSLDKIPPKQAPFYSFSEMHYLSLIDDDLYELLADIFTVQPTQGININQIGPDVFCLLFPQLSMDQCKKIIAQRDDPVSGKTFSSVSDLASSLSSVGNTSSSDELSKGLQQKNLSLVTTETSFKIDVQAQMNNAVVNIEAYVQMDPQNQTSGKSAAQTNSSINPSVQNPVQSPVGKSSSGLTITAMRIY